MCCSSCFDMLRMLRATDPLTAHAVRMRCLSTEMAGLPRSNRRLQEFIHKHAIQGNTPVGTNHLSVLLVGT